MYIVYRIQYDNIPSILLRYYKVLIWIAGGSVLEVDQNSIMDGPELKHFFGFLNQLMFLFLFFALVFLVAAGLGR